MRVGDDANAAFYLGFRSSGGGTRTHNLRINSPPLCQLSYPGTERRQSTNGPSLASDSLPSAGTEPAEYRSEGAGMKFILGAIVGFLIGYNLAQRDTSPDSTTRRLVDGATRASLVAVQRARTTIQSRLTGDGDAQWN
jgi:hypothetical protein